MFLGIGSLISAVTFEHMSRIIEVWNEQRRFFGAGETHDFQFRKKALVKLKDLLVKYEREMFDAMRTDLGRGDYDTFMAENVVVYDELKTAIKQLKNWMKPTKVATSMQFQPASSEIHYQPMGQVLIISPWNYPFHLSLAPLVGAIAAGNCAIIKPSEMVPTASKVLAKLINDNFETGHVHVIEGGKEEALELLEQKFDLIFYTGGVNVAKSIYATAAKNLTPVVLELGGKSPCIVHKDADLKVAAKRVVWGKFLNAGQTCLAPDYLLLHSNVKGEFIYLLQETIKEFFTEDPIAGDNWPRIVSEQHFKRLQRLKEGCKVLYDGGADQEKLKMGPTLLEVSDLTHPIMDEEIFGPILPIIIYDVPANVLAAVNQNPDPLALYLFTKDKNFKKVILQHTRSGGVAINDCLLHAANGNMPFGGVGSSGMGTYHHRFSFETFSHKRSVMDKKTWFDPSMRYPPYSESDLKMLKRFSS